MIKAFIKGWKKVQQTDQESKHSYTVYVIEVNNNGLCHTVSRRYSEFDELNKALKKWVPQSEVPEFPGMFPFLWMKQEWELHTLSSFQSSFLFISFEKFHATSRFAYMQGDYYINLLIDQNYQPCDINQES